MEVVANIIVAYNLIDNINIVITSLHKIVPLIYATNYRTVWENSCSISKVNEPVNLNRLQMINSAILCLLNKRKSSVLSSLHSNFKKFVLLVGFCLGHSKFDLIFESLDIGERLEGLNDIIAWIGNLDEIVDPANISTLWEFIAFRSVNKSIKIVSSLFISGLKISFGIEDSTILLGWFNKLWSIFGTNKSQYSKS